MKHSKIEKAIVLSLLLSSSLYGTVEAKEVSVNRIDTSTGNTQLNYKDDNVTITYDKLIGDSYIYKGMAFGIWAHPEYGKDRNYEGTVNSLTINVNSNKYESTNDAENCFTVGILSGRDEIHPEEEGVNTTTNITTINGFTMNISSTNNQFAIGSWTRSDDTTNLTSNNGNINITVNKNDGDSENEYLASAGGIRVDDNAHATVTAEKGNITIEADNNVDKDLVTKSDKNYDVEGITAKDTGSIKLTAGKNIDITANTYNGNSYGILAESSNVQNKILDADNNVSLSSNSNIITAISKNGEAHAIYADNSNVELTANNGVNYLSSTGNGITVDNNAKVSFNGDTIVKASKTGIDIKNSSFTTNGSLYAEGEEYGLVIDNKTVENENKIEIGVNNDSRNTFRGEISALKVNNSKDVTINGITNYFASTVNIDNSNVIMKGSNFVENKNNEKIGIDNQSSTLTMGEGKGVNYIVSKGYNAIKSINGVVTLNSNKNIISAGTYENGYYNGTAINATNSKNDSSVEEENKVNILGSSLNDIAGTVRANGKGTVVNIGGYLLNSLDENDNLRLVGTGSNYIVATTHGRDGSSNSDVVSAVYAQNGADINLASGGVDGINYIKTKASDKRDENGDSVDKERAVWAEKGTINLYGKTIIETTNGSITEPNNVGIAIAAGGVEGAENGKEHDAFVDATLSNGSYIFGDILAGAKGQVDLNVNQLMPLADNDMSAEGITIQGNILAANGGAVNANLGANSVLTGRIDSYMDATEHPEHGSTFFAPEFSNEIETQGKVSLSLGDNSRWNVVGQSWVTEININGDNTVIDMVGSNTDKNENGHALTIETLNGDANFKMSLKGDAEHSNATDMIYIKNGNGNFDVVVDEALTENDITDAGLRFATIGNGSNVNFKNVGTYNDGAFDVLYTVEKSDYDANDTENGRYNGETGLSQDKPGDDNVDDFFKPDENTPAVLDENEMAKEASNASNYEIVGIAGREINDIGKTIINLSRANYANAVYMDDMNKRLGEARYLEGNEGFWVKLGHNSIGKDNTFEIDNNVYQVGYDKLHQEENGARRTGVVADYMTGDTSYDNIAANGEVSRKGLWLYDTWTGNDGHYTDFVAKWGHLENNFDIYVPDRDVVNGEYNNDVFALSGEYGYKKDLGNDWYIEPQVQLQYAYVTGADYTTSQNTNVSVDAIDSLITRAGFRLGKEFGQDNQTSVYLKGDIVHEFLGDQDIRTWDDTGVLNETFNNDGTWYNVGIGVSTMLSDNSYAYVDYERSFGNDNDNTYQVNGGVRWAF